MDSPSLYMQLVGRCTRIHPHRAFEVAGTSTDDVLALAERLGVADHPYQPRRDELPGRTIIVHRYELPEPPFSEESAA